MQVFHFGIFIPMFFIIPLCNAQYWSPQGSRSIALGGSSVTLNDEWAVHNNPAGMALSQGSSVAASYENNFFTGNLGYRSIAATFTRNSGAFGLRALQTGDKYLNYLLTGVAYARKLGQDFSAGVQLNAARTSIGEGYGTKYLATFELGILFKLQNKLVFGAHLFNPILTRLSTFADERLPALMEAGLCYSYSENFLAIAQVRKQTNHPLEYLGGLEYRILKLNAVRVGFSTNPFRYTFGYGLHINQLTFDVGSSYHSALGFSASASCQYSFGSRKL